MTPVVMIACLFCLTWSRYFLYTRSTQERLHSYNIKGCPLAVFLQPHIFGILVLLADYCYVFEHLAVIFSNNPKLEPKFPDAIISSVPSTKTEALHIDETLRVMCFVAPLTVGCSFVITIVHVFLHFPAKRGFDEHIRWCPTFSHDLAIQVALLPLVYGIFAMDSVHEILVLVTGAGFQSDSTEKQFDETLKKGNDACEANLQFADLYEAWALRAFAVLCFLRVSRQIRLEVPTVRYIIETVKRHVSQGQSSDSRDKRILDDLILLNSPEKLLFEPLQQTANIGVMVFVYTYAIKSIYLLTLRILADSNVTLPGVLDSLDNFQRLVDGAMFLASTLAIYNLVVFEHKLKDILKGEMFLPFEKFLSVKILVSIAFFQTAGLDFALGKFFNFTEMETKLANVCLLSFEVFPISVLVLIAWRPRKNDWYGGDCLSISEDSGRGEATGQLAREYTPSDANRHSFVASRQPLHMVEEDGPLGYDVAATIELHGRVSARHGQALVDVVNTMSDSITAVYKPAALFRDRSCSGGAAAGLIPGRNLVVEAQPLAQN